MTSTIPSQRPRSLHVYSVPSTLLAAIALVALSGCGDGDDPDRPTSAGAGQIVRLDLAPTNPGPKPENRIEWQAQASEDPAVWVTEVGEGGDSRFLPIPPNEASMGQEDLYVPALFVKSEKDNEPWTRYIAAKTQLDPQKFNTVQVDLDLFSVRSERIRLAFLFEGNTRYRTKAIEVSSKPIGPRPILFDLPIMRRAGGVFDEVRVEFKGEVNEAALSQIIAHEQPLQHFVPGGQSEGAGMLALGTEGRSGRPLCSAAPIQSNLVVPKGGELCFSYALVETLRMPDQSPELTVVISAEGVPTRTETYDLDIRNKVKAKWHEARISLEAFDDKQTTVQFNLGVSSEHDGWAFVAEPRVRVKGTKPPTVLLITSDTHRADHLGSKLIKQEGGVVLVKTPNLEELGARGVHFTDAFTSTNITNPSHVALMTGLGPRDTLITNNHQPLVERATTVAELFRDAGYRTLAGASAFHLQHDDSGLGQGFDRLDAPDNGQRWGGVTVDQLETWMDSAEGEPLFVWLHVFDAHAPYAPPPEFDRRYYDKDIDPFDPEATRNFPEIVEPQGPLKGLKDADFPRAQYRAGVDYVDQLVGRVLAWPRMSDATIAFTADHGECFGKNGVWFDHAELFPASVHVPLILAGPGVPDGVRSDHPVRQIDVSATLLDLAGIDQGEFPGKSLLQALEPGAPEDARYIMAAHRMSVAIRSGKWHAILHLKTHREWSLEALKEIHAFELYDLTIDPSCSTNLRDREPRQAARLRQALIKWVNESPTEGMGRNRAVTAEQADALADMGYSGDDDAGSASFDVECDCPECQRFGE
jgi:arylsulfatase A-like enzyme